MRGKALLPRRTEPPASSQDPSPCSSALDTQFFVILRTDMATVAPRTNPVALAPTESG